ncbi:MAG: preprotein translocase subunit YajC [Coriobacteriia bacterium]
MNAASYGPLIYFAVIVAVFYFLIIKPQAQRTKEHDQLLASLAVDDQVITAGGLYGTIRALEDDRVELEIASGIVVEVARPAITKRLEG